MRRIVWSDEAIRELEGIGEYIANFAPLAAGKLVGRIVDVSESLVEFPDRGRPAANGVREITAISPYIIRYRVNPETVLILQVRHAARRPE